MINFGGVCSLFQDFRVESNHLKHRNSITVVAELYFYPPSISQSLFSSSWELANHDFYFETLLSNNNFIASPRNVRSSSWLCAARKWIDGPTRWLLGKKRRGRVRMAFESNEMKSPTRIGRQGSLIIECGRE